MTNKYRKVIYGIYSICKFLLHNLGSSKSKVRNKKIQHFYIIKFLISLRVIALNETDGKYLMRTFEKALQNEQMNGGQL